MNIRIPENISDKLNEIARNTGYKLTEIIIKLIEAANLDLTFNTEQIEKSNDYQFLDKTCPGLAFINDNWCCVFGRENNTPNIKKLGPTKNDAKEACSACTRTKNMLEENKMLKNHITKGVVINMPFCKNGGYLRGNDLKTFYCKMIGDDRKVSECKTLRGGQPCQHLRWSQKTVPVRKPDLNK